MARIKQETLSIEELDRQNRLSSAIFFGLDNPETATWDEIDAASEEFMRDYHGYMRTEDDEAAEPSSDQVA